ncbi:hypothetical protein ACQEVB_35725 [Pseudonocardia sp. CA-107938]|uniref:hypothetical protein n=1 Tax=Pseudonocardia sp. CA-107938 TaxID=3240021 RepID=UPI003D89E73F
MPIPLPVLDDLTFDDLVAQARARIPALAPGWTDHNPGDPGITLVELLAWLTEMLVYGVEQIPDAHTVAFLRLLNGPGWTPPADLDAAVRTTVRGLRARYRAVTADDYEHLVAEVWPTTPEAAPWGVPARVRCLPGEPGHVSVVVVPRPTGPDDRYPEPDAALVAAIEEFLRPRRLLTTHHHVVGPGWVDVAVTANVALADGAPPVATLDAACARLAAHLDPTAGWPFGRPVHPSEACAVLAGTPLVDHVEDVVLTGADPAAHELIRLTSVDLVGYDAVGRTHPFHWWPA